MDTNIISNSNISRFESMYAKAPYHEEEDIYDGVEILSRNSGDGLYPHQHFQEDRPVIDDLCCSQDDLSLSVRICR